MGRFSASVVALPGLRQVRFTLPSFPLGCLTVDRALEAVWEPVLAAEGLGGMRAGMGCPCVGCVLGAAAAVFVGLVLATEE